MKNWRQLLATAYSLDKAKDLSEREGVDNLIEAGYVEEDRFKNEVIEHLRDQKSVFGYFCTTCEYNKPIEGNIEVSFCDKLKADIRPWGCCNYWEYSEDDE